MKYQLICVDIDGTLLNDEKKLLPQVKKSIQNAVKQGIQVALISGRFPAGVELLEKELGVQCIKVCNAGTYILLNDRCIYSEHLLPATMKAIYQEIAKKNQIPLWIFQERKWFVTEIDHFIEKEAETVRYQPEVADAECLADCWEQEGTGPSKLVIAAEPKLIREIYQEMKGQPWEDIDIACSADTFLEIFPKGTTKGTALKNICTAKNIPTEATIAFGDHELDIPMIEAAGLGIAMGNAIDQLKEKADFVTKTNNEAGVAYALEYFLGND